MVIGIFIVGWVICGGIAAGGLIAYAQQEWPSFAKDSYRQDLNFSILLSLAGPITLIISVFSTKYYKHGWYLRYKEPRGKLTRP